jgi:hypothetical protein
LKLLKKAFKGRCKDNKMSKMLKYAEKIHLIEKSGKKVLETSSAGNQNEQLQNR